MPEIDLTCSSFCTDVKSGWYTKVRKNQPTEKSKYDILFACFRSLIFRYLGIDPSGVLSIDGILLTAIDKK